MTDGKPVEKSLKDLSERLSQTLSGAPKAEHDLITIQFERDKNNDGDELKRYLEQALAVNLQEEFVESEAQTLISLFIAPAAVSVATYAGKKFIDVLVDLLQAWLRGRDIPEVNVYGPDGRLIRKISSKK